MSDAEISTMMDSISAAARMEGMSGILYIVICVICIWAAWWALQSFRFDVFLRNPKSPQARLLTVLVSIIIGYLTARFIIDYLSWSLMIKSLV